MLCPFVLKSAHFVGRLSEEQMSPLVPNTAELFEPFVVSRDNQARLSTEEVQASALFQHYLEESTFVLGSKVGRH